MKRTRRRRGAGGAGPVLRPLAWWLAAARRLLWICLDAVSRCAGLARGEAHDLVAHGAFATPAASRKDSRRILRHKHLLRVLADNLGGDVGHEGAEADEAAVRRERPAAEASSIVADEVQRAELADEPANDALAGVDDGARPECHTSQRRCLPHGGRQLSWWYHGRCHRMDKGGADGRWWIRERSSALRSTHEEHTSTPRSTQVQGPREEVKPLLLLFCVYMGVAEFWYHSAELQRGSLSCFLVGELS